MLSIIWNSPESLRQLRPFGSFMITDPGVDTKKSRISLRYEQYYHRIYLGLVTFYRLKISDVSNKKTHSDAPGDSLLARPRRCGVPKMRYNEFGKPTPDLFYLNQRSTFLKIILVIKLFFFSRRILWTTRCEKTPARGYWIKVYATASDAPDAWIGLADAKPVGGQGKIFLKREYINFWLILIRLDTIIVFSVIHFDLR